MWSTWKIYKDLTFKSRSSQNGRFQGETREPEMFSQNGNFLFQTGELKVYTDSGIKTKSIEYFQTIIREYLMDMT